MTVDTSELIKAFKINHEIEKKMKGTPEGAIKKVLDRQIPKLQKIHDVLYETLEKHYKEGQDIGENETYLKLLLLETGYVQSALCKYYGIPTPKEKLSEMLKNADIQS